MSKIRRVKLESGQFEPPAAPPRLHVENWLGEQFVHQHCTCHWKSYTHSFPFENIFQGPHRLDRQQERRPLAFGRLATQYVLGWPLPRLLTPPERFSRPIRPYIDTILPTTLINSLAIAQTGLLLPSQARRSITSCILFSVRATRQPEHIRTTTSTWRGQHAQP
jgi:hypothetical protein